MKIKLLGLGVILTSAGLIFAGQHGAKSGSATKSRHGHLRAKQAAHQSHATGGLGGTSTGFNDGSSPLLSPSPSPSPSPDANLSPPPQ